MKSSELKSSARKTTKLQDTSVCPLEKKKSVFECRKPVYEIKFRDSYLQTSLLPSIERTKAIKSLKIKEKVQKIYEKSEVHLRGKSEGKATRPVNKGQNIYRFKPDEQIVHSAQKLNDLEENFKPRQTSGLNAFNPNDTRSTRFRFKDRSKNELRKQELVQGIPKKLSHDQRDTYLRTCHSSLRSKENDFPSFRVWLFLQNEHEIYKKPSSVDPRRDEVGELKVPLHHSSHKQRRKNSSRKRSPHSDLLFEDRDGSYKFQVDPKYQV